jgi:hypothetical protein
MIPYVFKYKDSYTTFQLMSQLFKKRIGSDKFESVYIKNSGHLEQMDRVITEEKLMMTASIFMSGITELKKEGSNVEFHEYLGLLWLEFLFKIGHHDNTFNPND